MTKIDITPQLKDAPVIDASLGFGMRALTGLISRLQLANLAGLQYGGDRNLYTIFGYKPRLDSNDFLAKYTRQDIASRIVDAPPNATWSHPPRIINNEVLMDAWKKLAKPVDLWGAMNRADKLARLNPYSILLFGFDDGGELKSPVGKNVKQLTYVRAIGTRQIDKIEFEDDERNPRFGLVKTYEVKFDDPVARTTSGSTVAVRKTKDVTIHWSRTIHIVENPLEDMVFGNPVIERVYNLLDDLLKVAGGTAEMFWLSGRSGIQADIDKEMELDPVDTAALADEIKDFMNQLTRFVRTRGVTLSTLNMTVPDPKQVFEMIMALISGTTGIPRRILLGSEAGQLASEQDRANWAERITERRALYAGPHILDPTVLLLQRVGLLKEGDVEWEWPSAFIQNPLEEGQTMAQKARAIGNMARQTGNKAPMQITSRPEAREILGLEGDLSGAELLVPIESEEPQGTPDGEGNGDGARKPQADDDSANSN